MEVHPPEHPIHTWRDFFIHIATIVVGLLIAIGLEQTVEALHRHHELKETREALQSEAEENQKFFINNVHFFRAVKTELAHNLASLRYIQQNRGATLDQLPFAISFLERYNPFSQAAWTTAGENGGRPLLSREELGRSDDLYWELSEANRRYRNLSESMVAAARYSLIEPDATRLTPEMLQAEIDLVALAIQDNLVCASVLIDIADDHAEVAGPERISRAELVSSYQPPDTQQANPAYLARQAAAQQEFTREAPEGYAPPPAPRKAEK